MFGLSRQEFEQMQRDSEGQRSLACCSSWVCKESDMNQRLNDNNHMFGLLAVFLNWYIVPLWRSDNCLVLKNVLIVSEC